MFTHLQQAQAPYTIIVLVVLNPFSVYLQRYTTCIFLVLLCVLMFFPVHMYNIAMQVQVQKGKSSFSWCFFLKCLSHTSAHVLCLVAYAYACIAGVTSVQTATQTCVDISTELV